VDLLVERAPVGLDHDVGVRTGRTRYGIDCLAGALVFGPVLARWVLDQRRFEDEQRLYPRERLDLSGEEVGDGVQELGVVAVVLVGREVRERVGSGDDRLQFVGLGEFARRRQLVGDVAVEGQLVGHDRVSVEVVVVVVPDDAPGLHRVVDRERMGQHVVPPELSLDRAVESSRLLTCDDFLACSVVGVSYLLALGAVDEVVLLVAFQIGEVLLRPVRKRKYSYRGCDVLCHVPPSTKCRRLIFSS
jgi:hypothetical protein